MVDKIEMSLDDIIKQTKGSRARGGNRRGRGTGNSPRRGARRAQRVGGGVMRGRNRGGIARSSLPYTRVRKRYEHVSSSFPLLNLPGICSGHAYVYCIRVRARARVSMSMLCVRAQEYKYV